MHRLGIDWGPCVHIAGGPDDLRRLGPDRLAIVEQWDSAAALEAHATSAHMVEGRARIAQVLLSRDRLGAAERLIAARLHRFHSNRRDTWSRHGRASSRSEGPA
ncbi:MAG: putative quinol monooxygenase [Janthinobacterium lividum]